MTAVVSLLRGVNVGGHRMIGMDALRGLYGSLGLQNVQTYIQSGNVVFTTEERNLPPLAGRISAAIEHAFGFRPDVVLRTANELREVVAGNPFATRPAIDPSKLHVTFLAGDLSAEARKKVLEITTDPEELRVGSRHLYIYYPDGAGRAKLSMALVERTLKTPATGRNWNTVAKLLAMAETLEASL